MDGLALCAHRVFSVQYGLALLILCVSILYVVLRQGSVTGVILVGRSDSLGFHSVTWLVGF